MNNDQQIMENLLLTTKGVCDLYLHGAIESATPDVHQAFDGALGESLDMQVRYLCRNVQTAAGIKTSRPTPSKSRRYGRNFVMN